MSHWVDVLDVPALEARFALTASLDPRFARAERAFYQGRTVNDLKALAHQAWLCCEGDAYQLARSYLALKGE